MRDLYKSKDISFVHTNKLRYQLEISSEIKLPKEFTRVGNKMRRERYRVVTTELTKLSAELE